MFMSGAEEGGDIFAGYNFGGGTGTPTRTCRAPRARSVWENTMDDLRVPQLPWAVQEDWGCERTPTEVDVLVAENDKLRAAITPQWGGKVWSLYDKQQGRSRCSSTTRRTSRTTSATARRGPPAAAEWNWAPGKIGHSVFSEAPVWTAVLPTERGPVVRVWEYDRLNSSVWQVDMLFEDDVMYAHARLPTRPPPTSEDTGTPSAAQFGAILSRPRARPRWTRLVSTMTPRGDDGLRRPIPRVVPSATLALVSAATQRSAGTTGAIVAGAAAPTR